MLYYPAALKLHHAHRGGLMYHTSTMLDTAKQVVSVYGAIYPELCSDLVYAGVILHDIAKRRSLKSAPSGLQRRTQRRVSFSDIFQWAWQ